MFNHTHSNVNKFWLQYFGVVNLTDKEIDWKTLTLLGKGIKFCPTPPSFDHGPLKENIDSFFRKLSLHLFFSENSANIQENARVTTSPFKHKDLKCKSAFNPPMPLNLYHLYQNLTDKILDFNSSKKDRCRNLNNQQYENLRKLSKDNSIIIKKADKGSNIVLQTRENYITECENQLNNKHFYIRQRFDNTKRHKAIVENLLLDMLENDEIHEQTYKYLTQGGLRTSVFYTLPKIHKDFDKIPPGRPIVSSIDSPTEKISQMLDIILQPFVEKMDSYLRDTPDFISKISDIVVSQSDILFTMDVTGLYTNIPHDEGIAVIRKILDTRELLIPSTNNLIKMLELVLKLNNFKFNNKHYLQVSGTAMGTRVAPTYANLFMEHYEKTYIYPHKHCPRKWLRFIDDVWGLFKGTPTEFMSFYNDINQKHPTIKFTIEWSYNAVNFLDLTVFKNSNALSTRTYFKPTDSHSYLDFSSCHQLSIKRSIPQSQFLRMRRNCTEWTDFMGNSLKIMHYLKLRSYPHEIILEGLKKVCILTQKDTLSPAIKSTDAKKFFCIVQYNPTLPPIKDWLTEVWTNLDRSSSTRPLIDYIPILGYSRPKNIGEYLCRSDISEQGSIKRVPPRCHRPFKCKHCSKLNKTGKIISKSTGRNYKIMKNVTCCSKNLIYCISCNECGIQYVGQTRNKLLTRINAHLSDIRTNKCTPTSRHFNTHSLDYTLHILQLCNEELGDRERNKWEDYWIARLNSITPNGLNILD